MISWWCFCFALNNKNCTGIKLLPSISSSLHPACQVGKTGWCLVYSALLTSGASMLKSLLWVSQNSLYLIVPSIPSFFVSSFIWTSSDWAYSRMEHACVHVETPLELCKWGYSHHRSACLWCVNWDEVSCVSGRQPCLHLFNSSAKFTEHRGTSVGHAVSTP